MATTLAFGTYISGNSLVHRLNAQVKIALTCAFAIVVFLINTWAGLGTLVAATIIFYALARVPITSALSGIKPVVFILLFTIIVHAFSINVYAEQVPGLANVGSLGLTQSFVIWKSFGITLDGLVCGLYFALRIAMLIALCSLLTFTTSLVELTDALLKLFAPLRKLKVPVDDFAMMISIALRFIPTTALETQNIVMAQKARCANFDASSLVTRIKAWVPVFIPLFVRLFRRADELANAMDSRCYQGEGRTCSRVTKIKISDIVVLLLFLVALVVLAIFL